MFHTGAPGPCPGANIFLEDFVDMNLAKLGALLRYLAFGISLGTVSGTVMVAAMFLAIHNTLPENLNPSMVALLLLASLLATAPLIGWWYNLLRHLFRIDFTGDGGSR